MNQKQKAPLKTAGIGFIVLVIGGIVLSGANRDANASEWTFGVIVVIVGAVMFVGGLVWAVQTRD